MARMITGIQHLAGEFTGDSLSVVDGSTIRTRDLIAGTITSNIGDKNMAQRRTVIIEIFDDSAGIEDKDCLVYYTELVTSKSDVNKIIQNVLLEEASEIQDNITGHNHKRISTIDLDILKRTGNEVNLRPIKFKDLRISVR